MSRSIRKVGIPILEMFEVFDGAELPVTGLTNGSFAKSIFKDGVSSGVFVMVSEVGSGRYLATWTPNATGYWHLHITNATYNKSGWASHFDVTTDGVPQIAEILAGILDAPATVDGYTLRQTLKLMSSVLCGKDAGGPGAPVFRSMNDAADRVASVADASGNRTTVTLTP